MKMVAVIGALWLGTLMGGCGYLEGSGPRARPAISGQSEGRPCTWLPEERDQWRLRRSAVGDKVRRVVLPGLQASELDAWLIFEREFQRDPLMDSLGLTDPGDKAVLLVDGGGAQLRAFAFGTTPQTMAQLTDAGLFEQVLLLTPEAMQDTLARFRPRRIGINYSARVPLADGVATGSRQVAAWLVGHQYAGAFRSAETLAGAFRATRTADEIELARQAARCAAEIAERALAPAAIQPGHTTAAELAWHARADIRAAQLEAPSMPRVSVIKLDDRAHLTWPWLGANTETPIAGGDLVHIDLELRYAGVAATVQRTGYVPGRWERDVPAEIRRAFDALAQVRGGLAPLFRPGTTGSQLAVAAGTWAQQHQLRVDLTAHPVGNTPRDVGTLVQVATAAGPYDMAGVLAERPLQEHDTQSLAFRVTVPLADGRRLMLSAADDAVVGFGGLDLLGPPQSELLH